MKKTIAKVTDKARSIFSATQWFKRGELQTELAAATAAAGSVDPLTGPNLPLGVADDPALTSLDDRRLSLQIAGTPEMSPARKGAAMPGERMTEREEDEEIAGPRKSRWLVAGGIGSLMLMAAGYLLFIR